MAGNPARRREGDTLAARHRSSHAATATCAAVLALGTASCAKPAATTTAANAAPAAQGIARFLPLEDGTVFSYETRGEPGDERGLLVLEVRRPSADRAELVVAGRVTRLVVSAAAVSAASGGFLLREPLVAGAEWKGDFGHVRITHTDQRVTTPAGTFAGCLETVEELATRDAQKRTTTTYCPGVGITVRETEAEQAAERQSERITLKSYGPRFDPAHP
jgi:hypothetical protein